MEICLAKKNKAWAYTAKVYKNVGSESLAMGTQSELGN